MWPGAFTTVGRVRSTWVSPRTSQRCPELGRGETAALPTLRVLCPEINPVHRLAMFTGLS